MEIFDNATSSSSTFDERDVIDREVDALNQLQPRKTDLGWNIKRVRKHTIDKAFIIEQLKQFEYCSNNIYETNLEEQLEICDEKNHSSDEDTLTSRSESPDSIVEKILDEADTENELETPFTVSENDQNQSFETVNNNNISWQHMKATVEVISAPKVDQEELSRTGMKPEDVRSKQNETIIERGSQEAGYYDFLHSRCSLTSASRGRHSFDEGISETSARCVLQVRPTKSTVDKTPEEIFEEILESLDNSVDIGEEDDLCYRPPSSLVRKQIKQNKERVDRQNLFPQNDPTFSQTKVEPKESSPAVRNNEGHVTVELKERLPAMRDDNREQVRNNTTKETFSETDPTSDKKHVLELSESYRAMKLAKLINELRSLAEDPVVDTKVDEITDGFPLDDAATNQTISDGSSEVHELQFEVETDFQNPSNEIERFQASSGDSCDASDFNKVIDNNETKCLEPHHGETILLDEVVTYQCDTILSDEVVKHQDDTILSEEVVTHQGDTILSDEVVTQEIILRIVSPAGKCSKLAVSLQNKHKHKPPFRELRLHRVIRIPESDSSENAPDNDSMVQPPGQQCVPYEMERNGHLEVSGSRIGFEVEDEQKTESHGTEQIEDSTVQIRKVDTVKILRVPASAGYQIQDVNDLLKTISHVILDDVERNQIKSNIRVTCDAVQKKSRPSIQYEKDVTLLHSTILDV